MNINLLAPCGLYCGSCRQYLARSEGILEQKGLKHGCEGCRIRDKNCTFVKKDCPPLRKKEIDFCYECSNFPCDNLIKLSEIYVTRYNVSLIENLKRLKKVGIDKWLEEQIEYFKCPKCGGKMCIHDSECFNCGYIEKK